MRPGNETAQLYIIMHIMNAPIIIIVKLYATLHAIFVDSSPAAPSGLEQVPSGNTLTSATFTWQEPTDTGGGGIDTTCYTVYTSVGSPVNTTTLSHTLTGLEVDTDYTVSVTATNECGLASASSDDLIIRIPAGSTYNYKDLHYACMHCLNIAFLAYHKQHGVGGTTIGHIYTVH